MRQPHPWYSETRSGGGWFVKLSNEQHFLGKQPEGAAKPVKRNGRWNPASEILAEYHKLMAVRDTASKSYRGINPLLLELHSMRHGFTSRWWGTINQWNSRGGTIMRRPADVAPGQWGARVIYFAPVKKKTVDKDTGEEATDRFLLMRGYTVFNLDQVEGATLDKFRADKEPEGDPAFADFAPAEELLKATGFEIKHKGEKAFYRRPEPFDQFPNHTGGDYIVLRIALSAPDRVSGGHPAFPRLQEVPALEPAILGCGVAGSRDGISLARSAWRSSPFREGRSRFSERGTSERKFSQLRRLHAHRRVSPRCQEVAGDCRL